MSIRATSSTVSARGTSRADRVYLPCAATKVALLRLAQLDPVLAGHYQHDSPPLL